ncbi:peptidoglycan DD-metalloendopeptidase family protein [Mariniflexile sp. AS56]|uniref:peptidoglycan DD-metalloendopeptidase family protein n=1 Tax=Mariniflexile sp. AS56 TaxID=3063957 RepID=UPI0026EC4DF3|nr:peptidoglycan DD-metalloendopeptidase family protein [Mariniflexile sp. AS56]MDO7173805.1 peptidoglycan DD-metalloendopeptidase family protein [Mariniflexile sp. AS56]
MATRLNFKDFLIGISNKPLRILDASIKNSAYIKLDLSEENEGLRHVDVSSSKKLETYITSHIQKHAASVAFGGYNEARGIYKRSTYFNDSPEKERNIHLGVDLWHAVNTPIYVPLDATVHSFKNNMNFGDYGPTIILKHQIKDVEFYTLYGHLSLASIENVKVNQVFKQGDLLGTLGDAKVNGDYPPHLHFQIIRDLQNFNGDYPGVCSKTDLDFYLDNCPDPNVLLKLEG